MTDDVTFIRHEACPACGAKDNLGRYSDGHGHCFGCGHYEHGEAAEQVLQRVIKGKRMAGLIDGDVRALVKRAINEETCKLWDYRVGTFSGSKVQIANTATPRARWWRRRFASPTRTSPSRATSRRRSRSTGSGSAGRRQENCRHRG